MYNLNRCLIRRFPGGDAPGWKPSRERGDDVGSRILWMETIGGGFRVLEPHLLVKQELSLIIINIIILNS
jgi:hypothetical protein